MPFLLDVDHAFPGGTKLTYDIGPTERVQMIVPTSVAHEVIPMDPNVLIGLSLQDVRGPATSRRPKGE